MIARASPGLDGLDVKCRAAATPASVGAAAAAVVALLFVAVLVLSDAINNGNGGGFPPAAVGQPPLQPITKLGLGTSGILPAEYEHPSMVADTENLGFPPEEAASQTQSENGPDPEPVYGTQPAHLSRRLSLGAAKEEDGSEEEGVGGRDDGGGASQGRTERSLRGVITRPEGSARCFVPEDGGPSRCHPNMFFVGVSKCGTTSFANWLEQHPEVRGVKAFEASNKQRVRSVNRESGDGVRSITG